MSGRRAGRRGRRWSGVPPAIFGVVLVALVLDLGLVASAFTGRCGPAEAPPERGLRAYEDIDDWQIRFGRQSEDEVANDIALSRDGTLIVTGSVTRHGDPAGRRVLVAAFNRTDGTRLWARTFDGPDAEGVAVDVAQDGSLLVAASLERPGEDGTLVLKLSPAGAELWRAFNESPSDGAPAAIAAAADGGAFVAGTLREPVDGGDALLARYSTTGDLLWTRRVGGPYADTGSAVAVDPAGGIFLAGTLTEAPDWPYPELPKTRAFVVKFDAGGNRLWDRPIGGPGTSAWSVTEGGEGGLVVGGSRARCVSTVGCPSDAFVARLDPSGTVDWQAEFSVGAADTVIDVERGGDGLLRATVDIRSGSDVVGPPETVLAVLKASGERVAVLRANEGDPIRAGGLDIDGDDVLYLAGTAGSGDPNAEIVLERYGGTFDVE